MRSETREVVLEVAIALVGVVMSIVFGFLVKVVLDPSSITRAQSNPSELKDVLAIQFELLITALSLLAGTALSQAEKDRGKLLTPVIVIGCVLPFLMLGLAGLSRIIIPNFHPDWLRIGAPDIVGACALFFSVRAAIDTRKQANATI